MGSSWLTVALEHGNRCQGPWLVQGLTVTVAFLSLIIDKGPDPETWEGFIQALDRQWSARHSRKEQIAACVLRTPKPEKSGSHTGQKVFCESREGSPVPWDP
jgi:hypothetical protein